MRAPLLLLTALLARAAADDGHCPGAWELYYEETKDKFSNVIGNWFSTAVDYGGDKSAVAGARVAGAVVGTAKATVYDPAMALSGFLVHNANRVSVWTRSDIDWQDRKKNMAIKCKHLWIEANKEIWSGKYYSGYTFYDNHYKPKGGGRGACGNWIDEAAEAAEAAAPTASTMKQKVCGTLSQLPYTKIVVQDSAEMPADQKDGLVRDMAEYYGRLWRC